MSLGTLLGRGRRPRQTSEASLFNQTNDDKHKTSAETRYDAAPNAKTANKNYQESKKRTKTNTKRG